MSHKMLKISLVISLAANLLVLGAIGGFFASGHHKDVKLERAGYHHGSRPRGPNLGFAPIIRAMDRKDRRALGRMIKKIHAENSLSSPDAFNGKLADLIGTTPFEPLALLDLLEQAGTQAEKRQTITRQVLVEQLAGMSAQERLARANTLKNGRR
jgi:hypothetical protein